MTDTINHSFNIEFASRYGIEESIIFGNIYHWCIHNKNNDNNLKKGKDGIERYYTFNSVSALQQEYRYISITKVYRVIEKLEDEGLIITGCFNKRVGDRTRWYAITEKGEQIFIECNQTLTSTLYNNAQFSNCKLQNEMHNLQNDRHNLQNDRHNLQNEMTLPIINKIINTNINSSEVDTSDFPEDPNEIKTKKTPSRAKKTKMHEEYLSSLSDIEREQSAKCVDLFIELHKQLDPQYNRDKCRPAWQVAFVEFHKESNRSYEQILQVIRNAMTNPYRNNHIYKPDYIFNNFEDIVQSMNSSKPTQYSKNRAADLERGNMNTGHRDYEVF